MTSRSRPNGRLIRCASSRTGTRSRGLSDRPPPTVKKVPHPTPAPVSEAEPRHVPEESGRPEDGVESAPTALENADENYEAFKSRWAQYLEAEFEALPTEIQTRFVAEVAAMSLPPGETSGLGSPPAVPFSLQLFAAMMPANGTPASLYGIPGLDRARSLDP
jgi:hypothetical protein